MDDKNLSSALRPEPAQDGGKKQSPLGMISALLWVLLISISILNPHSSHTSWFSVAVIATSLVSAVGLIEYVRNLRSAT